MRRYKIADSLAYYHCISRTIGGRRLWDDECRRVLRDMLWRVAGFCGVELVTYALLSNHFHILVAVPPAKPLSDQELLRRVGLLYGERSSRVERCRAILSQDPAQAEYLRASLRKRMHDVSAFMKELKQRFSIWYNKRHEHFGTTWAERFTCTIVDRDPSVLSLVAAYVDLNPVRAGFCADPKDYAWCGYAEALAGHPMARAGLCRGMGKKDWAAAARSYRLLLFERGRSGTTSSPTAATLSREAAEAVRKRGGRLTLPEILRCRLRALSYGGAIGRLAFARPFWQPRAARSIRRPLPQILDPQLVASPPEVVASRHPHFCWPQASLNAMRPEEGAGSSGPPRARSKRKTGSPPKEGRPNENL
jgi:putative transposase